MDCMDAEFTAVVQEGGTVVLLEDGINHGAGLGKAVGMGGVGYREEGVLEALVGTDNWDGMARSVGGEAAGAVVDWWTDYYFRLL